MTSAAPPMEILNALCFSMATTGHQAERPHPHLPLFPQSSFTFSFFSLGFARCTKCSPMKGPEHRVTSHFPAATPPHSRWVGCCGGGATKGGAAPVADEAESCGVVRQIGSSPHPQSLAPKLECGCIATPPTSTKHENNHSHGSSCTFLMCDLQVWLWRGTSGSLRLVLLSAASLNASCSLLVRLWVLCRCVFLCI